MQNHAHDPIAAFEESLTKTANIARESFYSDAQWANALAKYHRLDDLPEWRMETAARDLCEKYGVQNVVFGLPTMGDAKTPNPDAGFCVLPSWFTSGGNWYDYE